MNGRSSRLSIVSCALFVVLAVFSAPDAAADPVALRQPREGQSLSAAIGVPHSSVAFRFDNGLGLAVTLRLPATWLSADVSYRRLLVGSEDGWALAMTVWAGVGVPLIEPALAFDVGGALHARLRRRWFLLQLGAVVPASLRVTNGFSARAPVALDAWLGAQVWRVSFGLQGAAGATFVSQLPPSPYLQASAFLAVGL